jgi:hypothetical protein
VTQRSGAVCRGRWIHTEANLMSETGALGEPTGQEDLSASVLYHIPVEGTTLDQLYAQMKADKRRVDAAVERLLSLRLVEMTGDVIRSTSFAQKARGFFKFVA